MKNTEKIELTGEIRVPKPELLVTHKIKSHPAKKEHSEPLGFPAELLPDWKERLLLRLSELLRERPHLRLFFENCVRCGSCAEKCQFFLGTGDVNNMPPNRAELLRKIYRRYFTFIGKIVGNVTGELTDNLLDEWFCYFHQCSQCRRCAVFCPFGIDTAEISMAARELMNTIGMGQKYTNEVITKLLDVGNNLGMAKPALLNTIEFLEEDIKDTLEEEQGITGVDVKIPVDVEGAEVLLITPSADFFASPHIESLVGYAKVFHQAGISWTISTKATELGNFTLFIGSYTNMRKAVSRIAETVAELKPKRLIVGECGHGWRIAYSFWKELAEFADLDKSYPIPQHICEFTLDLINRGALKIDRSANSEFVVTFHDSCNVARASRMGDAPGSQFEVPRELIKAVCDRFIDMPEDTIKEKTFCCGAGGGLLTDELMDIRVRGALPRMEALKYVMDNYGVNFFALICAICKAQFTAIFPKFGLSMEMVGGVHQLVGRAIVLGAKE
jgi:Fe-S oxidoreductase